MIAARECLQRLILLEDGNVTIVFDTLFIHLLYAFSTVIICMLNISFNFFVYIQLAASRQVVKTTTYKCLGNNVILRDKFC